MTHAESFASAVSDRLDRIQGITAGFPNPKRMTGSQIMIIIGLIMKGCDEYNPGWREWLVNAIVRLLPPWGVSEPEQLRRRAEMAIDPRNNAPLLQRGRASNDRAMVLHGVREDRRRANVQGKGFDRPPDDFVADAILMQARVTNDAEIMGTLWELSHS